MVNYNEYKCAGCKAIFKIAKNKDSVSKTRKEKNYKRYCSLSCSRRGKINKIDFICANCGVTSSKIPSQFRKQKNHFCCQSCSASYNNTHKKHGTRRSKLEIYLEEKLNNNYPDLKMHFNRKDTINSELDIYLPSLKLAFELNGLFHYEPIYGLDKLNKIKNNDNRKFQACLEHNIELCIIDTSKFGYFKEDKARQFLKIITMIIDAKMNICD